MARNTSLVSQTDELTVKEILETYPIDYCQEVLNRLFARYSDGLKFSQLAFLLATYEETGGKLDRLPKAPAIIGKAMAKYYPNGDTELYLTGVNMACQRNPLFTTTGKLKSKRSKKVTAQRYAGLGLSPLGKEVLSLLNTDLVPKIRNYTNEVDVPEYLKSRIPYSLFCDNISIGWGVGSVALPWNAYEVLDCMSLLAEDPKTPTSDLIDVLKGPDVSEHTKVYLSKKSLASLIERGHGLVTTVCDVAIDKNNIVIEDVPWRENSDSVWRNIAVRADRARNNINGQTVMDSGIYGIAKGSLKNQSNENIRIIMKSDSETSPEDLVSELYLKTNLKKTYNITYILRDDNGMLELYGIRDILLHHIDINREAVIYKYTQQLKKLREKKDIAEVVELVTRESNKDWFTKQLYYKDKRDRLANRQLTAEEETLTSEYEANLKECAISYADEEVLKLQQDVINSLHPDIVKKLDEVLNNSDCEESSADLGFINYYPNNISDEQAESMEVLRHKIKTRGLTEAQIKTALSCNIANRLSDRDEALDTLAKYEENKLAILRLMSPENVQKEIIEYINYVKTLVQKDRLSEVFYTNPNIKSMIKDNAYTLEESEEYRQVYLTDNNFIGTNLDYLPTGHKITRLINTTTKGFIIVMTEHKIFKLAVKDITESFDHVSRYVGTGIVKAMFEYKDMTDYVLVSNKGGVKKVNSEEFNITKQSVAGYEFADDENVVKVIQAKPGYEVYMDIVSKNGFIRRLSVLDMVNRSRKSKFVNGIKLSEDDYIVDATLTDLNSTEAHLITETGILVAQLNPVQLVRSVTSMGNSIGTGICRFIDDNLGIDSQFANDTNHDFSKLLSIDKSVQFDNISSLFPQDAEEIDMIPEDVLNLLKDPDKRFYHIEGLAPDYDEIEFNKEFEEEDTQQASSKQSVKENTNVEKADKASSLDDIDL